MQADSKEVPKEKNFLEPKRGNWHMCGWLVLGKISAIVLFYHLKKYHYFYTMQKWFFKTIFYTKLLNISFLAYTQQGKKRPPKVGQ